MVWSLVGLVQAPVDLVHVLFDLVQAHPLQGGFILVVSRQVVVGPGLGLIGSVWWVFVRRVRRKQVCYSQVAGGLGVGLGVSGRKGAAGYIDTYVIPGVDAWIYSSISELKLSAPSSWGIFEVEIKFFNQGTALLHGGEDGGAQQVTPPCALVGSPGAAELTS